MDNASNLNSFFSDRQNKQGCHLFIDKLFYLTLFIPPKICNSFCTCITDIKPDYLEGISLYKKTLSKIRVFGYNYEIIFFITISNFAGGNTLKPLISCMYTIWIFILQYLNKHKAQAFIKEKYHATEFVRRRSRAAAQVRQARICSCFKSGKSSNISCSLILPARYSKTSYTVMRVLLIQGFPLQASGFTVI